MKYQIVLCCPQCGKMLSGDSFSAVFFCLPCQSGYSPEGESLRPHRLKYMDILRPFPAQAVYFAFWTFTSQCTLAYPLQGKLENSSLITYVPAFHMHACSAVTDIGLNYMRQKIVCKPGPAYNIPIFSCSRSWNAATVFPEIYLRASDPRFAAHDAHVSVSHRHCALALLPFYIVDDGYIDSQTLQRYHHGELF